MGRGEGVEGGIKRREVKEGVVTLGTLSFDPMHAEGGEGGSMAGMDHGKMAAPKAMAGMAMEGEPGALLRIDVKSSPPYARKIPATLSKLPAAKVPHDAPRRIKLAQDGKGKWTINGQV